MTTTTATPIPTRIPTRSARPNLGRDTWNVLVRELRPTVRDPFSLIFGLVQPLFFLGLFGALLVGGSGRPAGETLQWFVPGILVMIALFGTASTGSNLLFELQTGSHERTLVAPVSRAALLIGRALKELVPIAVQALLVALVTVPFGFRPDPVGMILGLALLAVFGVGLGAFSYALALASRTKDWMFWGVQQTLIFPLMILSGMLLPLDDAPGWMKVVATVNPLSHVVAAERALFAGELAAPAVLGGTAAAIVVLAGGLAVGIAKMRKAG